ncbi:MAG: very short patch repair endonuclease [bacterium]
MSDVFTKKKRSEVMSHIRAYGNKETELALAKLLRVNGVTGWRRHEKLLGKPDFVFRESRLAVFVDGCFWHCCPKHSNMPLNNRLFWRKKLNANKKRDVFVNKELRKQGWRVVRIWEHDLVKNSQGCIRRINDALTRQLSSCS